MLNGAINLSDGIKCMLGYGGLYLTSEDSQMYEEIFWKALRVGAHTIEESLDEIFILLGVEDRERNRLKHLFEVGAAMRRKPLIRIPY